MERKHIPQITDFETLDEHSVGWYFDPDCHYPREGEQKCVVFRCPNGHHAAVTLHSIEPNGEINASILCWKNDYHEFGILDGWPTNMRKRAGEHFPELVN
jgi:hypothetical protein